MISRLVLDESQYESIQAHVLSQKPEEACGLLGGRIEHSTAFVSDVVLVENALHSAVRFRMAPEAQVAALLNFERRGIELVAIFHSHPAGPGHLSATDLAEFSYPGVVMALCFPAAEAGQEVWKIRAFQVEQDPVDGSNYKEITLSIETKDPSNQKQHLGL
jgi:proteasome lid subunit RPN8/RPN11